MRVISNSIDAIVQQLDLGKIKSVTPVSGGDINQAYCIEGADRYFLKVNDAVRYPNMFVREAKGLNALRGIKNCTVPEVIRFGINNQHQFLVLEWIESGQPGKNFWENFGRALAQLHQRTQTKFGFHENNFIGTLVQFNSEKEMWGTFYWENRILPLVKKLYDTGDVDSSAIQSVEIMSSKFGDLFPDEKPSLLHGDLWSGNFMCDSLGNPTIYDPAVYYGHREMDLGMTLLFGGFHSRFYDAYHEAFPLTSNWKSRIELTQLYPLLVHAVLFGGSYVQRAVSIIKKYS